MTTEPAMPVTPANHPGDWLPWEEFMIDAPLGKFSHGLMTSWAMAEMSYEDLVRMYADTDAHMKTWEALKSTLRRIILHRMEEDDVSLTPPYGMLALRRVQPRSTSINLPGIKEDAKQALEDVVGLTGEWQDNAVSMLANLIDCIASLRTDILGLPWNRHVDAKPGTQQLRMVARLSPGPNTQPEEGTDVQRN